MIARRARCDISDQRDSDDSAEPIEAADPIESTEATDPAEPMLRMDPAEPIDRTEPFDATDSSESSDHSDQRERRERIGGMRSANVAPEAARPLVARLGSSPPNGASRPDQVSARRLARWLRITAPIPIAPIARRTITRNSVPVNGRPMTVSSVPPPEPLGGLRVVMSVDAWGVVAMHTCEPFCITWTPLPQTLRGTSR